MLKAILKNFLNKKIKLATFCICIFLSCVIIAAVIIYTINIIQSRDNEISELSLKSDEISAAFFSEVKDLSNVFEEVEIENQEELIDKDTLIEELENETKALKRDIKKMSELLNAAQSYGTLEDNFDKVAYLTFDDGPSRNTLQVIKILDRYHIKATFFVVHTDYAEENDIYNQIIDSGNTLGNHTYSHTKAYANWDNYLEDMIKMEDFLFEQTGIRPRILRFPGGTSSAWYESSKCLDEIQKLLDMGYRYFDWNVSTSDGGSNLLTEDDLLKNVIIRSYRQDKIIILMHDRADKNSTIEALPEIIEYLRDEGYVFLPLTTQSFTKQFFDINRLDKFPEITVEAD